MMKSPSGRSNYSRCHNNRSAVSVSRRLHMPVGLPRESGRMWMSATLLLPSPLLLQTREKRKGRKPDWGAANPQSRGPTSSTRCRSAAYATAHTQSPEHKRVSVQETAAHGGRVSLTLLQHMPAPLPAKEGSMDPFALVRLSLGPRTGRRELLGTSGLHCSVRDRGVGGSNPLAPTNFRSSLCNLFATEVKKAASRGGLSFLLAERKEMAGERLPVSRLPSTDAVVTVCAGRGFLVRLRACPRRCRRLCSLAATISPDCCAPPNILTTLPRRTTREPTDLWRLTI